jgi:hypothetical protein
MKAARAALAALLLMVAVPAAAAAARATGTQTILVTSVTVVVTSHDVTPKGPSKGDTVVLRDHLLNDASQFGKKKGVNIGADHATVTLSSANAATIEGKATLPGGTITISGTVTPLANGGLIAPVTGGTGAFEHVRGTLTVGPGKNRALNTYRLTRSTGLAA